MAKGQRRNNRVNERTRANEETNLCACERRNGLDLGRMQSKRLVKDSNQFNIYFLTLSAANS